MFLTNARSHTHTHTHVIRGTPVSIPRVLESWIVSHTIFEPVVSICVRMFLCHSDLGWSLPALHTKYAGCLCLCVLCVFVSWMVVSYLLHTHTHTQTQTPITHYPCVPERVRSLLSLDQKDLQFPPRYFYTVVPSWRRYAWPVEEWMHERVRVLTEVRMDEGVRGVNDCVSVLCFV
jgi:hypothetical protein